MFHGIKMYGFNLLVKQVLNPVGSLFFLCKVNAKEIHRLQKELNENGLKIEILISCESNQTYCRVNM